MSCSAEGGVKILFPRGQVSVSFEIVGVKQIRGAK